MPLTHRLFIPLTTLLIVLMASLCVPAARASDDQLSIMMDDDLLLYSGDQVRDAALHKMASAGVDMVRVTVLWSVVADHAKAGHKQHARFNKLGAANPKAYPQAQLGPLRPPRARGAPARHHPVLRRHPARPQLGPRSARRAPSAPTARPGSPSRASSPSS